MDLCWTEHMNRQETSATRRFYTDEPCLDKHPAVADVTDPAHALVRLVMTRAATAAKATAPTVRFQL